jgi:peptidoglycan/xylan/chitin deacetylase (PgdA/CDA1 family)
MRAMLVGAMVAVGLSCAVAARSQDSSQDCQAGPGMLGVSRVVEIDPSAGPRFGQLQYKDDLLKDKEVVLTFDDGPLRPYTRLVLDALSAHCTKATFFMVGQMAVADPEMAREVARRGHTIGTHTWSHRNLKALLPSHAQAEIELGLSAVQQAIGQPVAPFFRFPYLADSKALLAQLETRNIAVFSIDEDAYDYRTHNPEVVHRNIISQLSSKGKGIILFHDIHASTARALKGLLDDLKARGFRIVHLVPKSPATTLVEYNDKAVRELARRSAVATANPLVRRSIVWPLAQGRRATAGAGPSVNANGEARESWQERIFSH